MDKQMDRWTDGQYLESLIKWKIQLQGHYYPAALLHFLYKASGLVLASCPCHYVQCLYKASPLGLLDEGSQAPCTLMDSSPNKDAANHCTNYIMGWISLWLNDCCTLLESNSHNQLGTLDEGSQAPYTLMNFLSKRDHSTNYTMRSVSDWMTAALWWRPKVTTTGDTRWGQLVPLYTYELLTPYGPDQSQHTLHHGMN